MKIKHSTVPEEHKCIFLYKFQIKQKGKQNQDTEEHNLFHINIDLFCHCNHELGCTYHLVLWNITYCPQVHLGRQVTKP